MKTDRDIVCFDLCCGAGALSHGFSRAGAVILGGIDINPHAVTTARRNHPGGLWEETSIEAFSASLGQKNGHPVWSANTLLAGLPCQGFSVAGKRDPTDPRNSLYMHLVDVVARVQPRHVIFENVVGIASPRNAETFESLQSGLRRLGYDVAVRILNASVFGVPQNRKRVFLVAVKEGRAEWIFECLRTNGEMLTVKDAFRGLPATREIASLSHVFMNHGQSVQSKLRTLEPGGPFSYRRLIWNRPATTLVAGHRALPVHPAQPRAISVREAARIQGFSDDYSFEGPISAQIEQVANAVPPPLARALGSAIQRYREYGSRVSGDVFTKLSGKTSPSLRRRLIRVFNASFRSTTRDFPWRSENDPFRILVTEILLQRTNGELVERVWHEVLGKIPRPAAAASADLRRLGPLISRIGIRSRARKLRELGTTIRDRHGGRVPDSLDDLMRLPGVGIYIASAVRVFCFKKRDFPVDSNAFRFVLRYFGIPLRGKKSEGRQLREFMMSLMPVDGWKEYVYGFLDFAATVCRPIQPKCEQCPLNKTCIQFEVDRRA